MQMNERQNQPPGMTLADIYYVLFRHKWKIVILSAFGVVSAAVMYFAWPLPYQSEARLFVKYVVDTKNPGQINANDSRVSSPDERGSSILNTELEILSSYDLALQVANAIGPTNILAKLDGGTNAYTAAGYIRSHLKLDAPKNSSVIHVVFQHPDPAVVQPVLTTLISDYYQMHLRIHRDAGEFDDFLQKQTDELHNKLVQTEEALREAKTNLGIISIEDTKKVYADQMAQIQQQLLQAQSDLAERQAVVQEMAKLLHSKIDVTNQTAAATNSAPVSPDKLAEYKRVCGMLDVLNKRALDLGLQFTSSNVQVQAVQNQIAENEKLKEKLEADNPGLLTVKLATTSSGISSGGPQPDLTAELAKVSGLQSKINILTNQLNHLKSEAGRLYAFEGNMSDLQRRYDLQETQYSYFSMRLEQSRIDEALGPNRVSNISEIQAPTPPFKDRDKIQKVAALTLCGGFGLALALAFLLELYVDHSLRRPADIQLKLGLPLFASIPLIAQNGHSRGLPSPGKKRLLKAPSHESEPSDAEPHSSDLSSSVTSDGAIELTSESSANGAPNPQVGSAVRPFADALRDRLINYFEVKNLTHKPKLVALTSCSDGAGVSTVAAGLAASLSETGDGNVLLVDMHEQNGCAHQFFKGRVDCGLDDALEPDTREGAQVQENLYVVSEKPANENLPRVLPKRFRNLVPKLKASDYDYILFDMPRVSQVSITPRIARFMDMVLIVAEAEKTDREVVKRAASWLSENTANVGVVLNKHRKYVPRKLVQEL